MSESIFTGALINDEHTLRDFGAVITNSDVISNPNVRDAFGTGNAAGMYIFTENVWWAGGSR